MKNTRDSVSDRSEALLGIALPYPEVCRNLFPFTMGKNPYSAPGKGVGRGTLNRGQNLPDLLVCYRRLNSSTTIRLRGTPNDRNCFMRSSIMWRKR